ncbi:MAG TPA: TRAP transporter small permease [Castellaniella sp.]|jgi:TRAP-type C4-dicarboxylate transport system permease small subunit|nr:TRAP transporter small permease [Castellaniella sp.]
MPADSAPDPSGIYTPPPDPLVRIPLLLEDWVTVLTMAVLACITLANVIVRYLTSESFAWTEEISIFLLVVLTMSASGSAFVRRLHIRIEMLADAGSTERQRRFTLASTAICLLFFIVLTILLGRMALDDFNWGDTSPAIGVPVWWYSSWLPVLSTTISLRLIGMLQRAWRRQA